MLRVALKLAFYDRTKFAITLAGVAFAVTLVLVQIGLLSGILANATITIERSHADLWVTSKNTANIDFGHPFPDAYTKRVASIPGVERAGNLIVFYNNVALPNGAEETLLTYGVSDATYWGLPWDVLEGDLAELHGGRAFFLDDSAARRFGAFAVGDYREISNTRLRIAGRTRDAKSFTTVPVGFFDYTLTQRLMPELFENRTTYILVKLAARADPESVMREIKRLLPYNDVYTRQEWSERTRQYWLATTGLGMNMYVTVFLGCLVGVVVVAQTLYAATSDYIVEFGTLKAIGGKDRDVYRIVAWQAVIAAIGGFILGACVSMGTRELLRVQVGLDVMLSAPLFGAVSVGTLLLCLGASLFCFRRIVLIDPALVFRG